MSGRQAGVRGEWRQGGDGLVRYIHRGQGPSAIPLEDNTLDSKAAPDLARAGSARATVISASLRTDIPALYMPWLMNRVRAGYACYPNPFGGQICRVSLRPEEVHSIVFWSKDYGPFLAHVAELQERGFGFYCHFTITGAPRHLEPRVPAWRDAVSVFEQLVGRTSPQHVLWRFDPILLADGLGAEHYLARFREMTSALKGLTHRCYFSFAFFYAKVTRRLEQARILARDPQLEEKKALVADMAEVAADCGITLYSCCDDVLVEGAVQRASCVDGELLAELFPDRPLVRERRPTRDGCGCYASRDIGMYDTCTHGCEYCYANQNQAKVMGRWERHDPEGEMLVSPAAQKAVGEGSSCG